MKTTKTLILVVMITAALPGMASAATSVNDGYWVDSAGDIVKTGTGGCWHTIFWTPTLAVAGCDPVAAKDEPKPLPKMTAMLPLPPMPEKTAPQKINFSEASLFDFDKSVLKPDGKLKLDELVHELDEATYEIVYVTGHTDRIGSAKYNMELSLRRANEVKDYLVKKGIPADRIKVEGKGKTEPVTKPTDCRGMTSAGAIACLQPDRRTEVTVSGTSGSATSQK
jgi:OOP family OmpA-OmpF porin